jgi:hypothetical protein
MHKLLNDEKRHALIETFKDAKLRARAKKNKGIDQKKPVNAIVKAIKATGPQNSTYALFDMSPRLNDIFSANMETPDFVQKQRETLRTALLNNPIVVRRKNLNLPETCDSDEACKSGLCPVCMRKLRIDLPTFAFNNHLHEREWVFLTVRPKAWEIPAGNFKRIRHIIGGKPINTLPGIRALKERLRRAHKTLGNKNPPLIVIGSIEAPLRIEGNVPKHKAVHFHLLISGLPEGVIEKCAKGAFEVVNKKSGFIDSRIVHTTPVKEHWDNFYRSLNYSVSQPYIVENAMNEKTGKAIMIRPQPNHLAELASNWGPLSITDRLILIGVRLEKNGFRFS